MRYFAVLILFMTIAVGCNRPKTIEDGDLRMILQEVYLVNAYCSSNPINCDSLDIYEPILDKYGYTAADMKYTINGFSKRKSSRLTDVINEAILELEKEYKVYESKVAVLDTIDLIAAERFKTVIHHDSLLTINKFSDTAKLSLNFPAESGKYKITYNYQFDSTDVNSGLRGTFNIKDSSKYNVASNTAWLRTYSREKVDLTLQSSDKARKLLVKLVNYNKTSTSPKVKIDSLYIVHYLPNEVALDSINKTLVDYKLLIDGKEYADATKDSCSLRLHPPRIAPKGDSKR